MMAWSLAGVTVSVVQADSTVNQDFRLWAPVYLTFPLSSSFIGYMEVNPRFGDDVSELDQLILRPAVGYKLTDHFPLWQGTRGLEIISLVFAKKTACISNCFTVANFHLSKFSVAPGWKND